MQGNLTVLPTECDCEKCSLMCEAPCCGTPEDMKALMDAGYAKRLMLDDFSDAAAMLKPALKGFEGKFSPWETRTAEGCTFWKEGKCELHSLGLKPTLAKLVIHDQSYEEFFEIAEYIEQSWRPTKCKSIINRWKKECRS